jgi:RNA polymerase sigma factor (sigma-70 family)
MTSTLTSQNPVSLRLVADDTTSNRSDLLLPDLTRRMRLGDDEAWNEFHRHYYFALLRYAVSRAACPDDATEIVQQTYLRVARHIRPFTDEEHFWRWLMCVIRCVAVDHQRKVVRRALLMEKFAHWREVQRTTDRLPDVSKATSLANEALLELSVEDAQLLRLKYYEGWSVEQLALEARTTPKTIENRLARLRQRLRAIILRIQ